ncbi:pentatricopeptide repeat-containing protein At5g16860 [Solanum stenotomum]|uniref:pentatricopeptide repeat-containing protein At5g16860 n=1 Tax=Solanum stenotomum TaxID=172797 RepID=UPI0020D0B4B6|nr:pentatricopeptide repeat-containing protein At5g16860 [Solanum stenotomum]
MLVPASLPPKLSNSALFHFRFKSSSFFAFFTSSTPLLRASVPSSFTQLLKQCKSCIKAKLVVAGVFSPSADPTTWSSQVVFYWNNLIKRSVILRHHESALVLFREMLRLDWNPDGYTYPYVLKACGELRFLLCGESVHSLILASGLDSNVFVCNGVIAMYGKCGLLGHARQVFDETVVRETADVISWNSIVAAYVQKDEDKKVLELFDLMVSLNSFELRPDAVSLVNVLPACGSLGAWKRGKQLQGYAIRRCLHEDVFVGNAIVDMYAKCKRLDDANKVFELMEVKDVVSWNALVTGYSQIGRFDEALGLFERMREEQIDLNVVTWSAVISGYAQRDLGYEALNIFKEMRLSGAEPNVITLVSVLSGCAAIGALRQGKETHCYAIKQMLSLEGSNTEEDLMVTNALIDMYAKCKEMKIAQAMFDDIDRRDRNVVTWTVMIGGYAQHGDANDALELFSAMLKDEYSVIPNAYTISCALVACARLSSLRIGRQIHAYVLRQGYEPTIVFVANCLIDMYSKSGDVDAARLVFDNMSQRNTVSWTSLMTGYGMHGRGEEALQVFNVMRGEGLPIDGVTFLVVLYACSHSGMVDKGMNYFNHMKGDFGVVPGAEHYACMIDILGRAGRLDEAMKLIERMPMEPTSIVWVALLSACRVHKNVDLAEQAAAKLSELESENDGTYTLLSNIYANAKRWKDVARIRSLMKHSGIRKRPGCSWVQGKKETVTFFVGDRCHPMSEKIYDLLENLIHRIKAMGYVPETSFALHDVDDEEKGDLLIEHSEKLALAYGILTSAPGVPIRITKNLRVCGDCHTAMTYISKIIEHEIILRDSSRFHHIKNGSCSCRGFW